MSIPQPPTLSPDARALLASVLSFDSTIVVASNILEAAELLRAGLVRAEDDYEGPRPCPLDAAQEQAAALGLHQHPDRWGFCACDSPPAADRARQ